MARGRYHDASGYLITGFRVVFAGSLFISVVGLAAIAVFSSGAGAASGEGELFLLAILFAGIPFLAFEFYLVGIARSFGWFVLAAAPGFVLRPLVMAAVLFLAELAGVDLDANLAFGIVIAVTGLTTIGQAVVLRRRVLAQIGPRPRPVRIGRQKIRLWLTATLPLIAVYGVEEIYLVSDVLLLGLLADPAEVGIYFGAVRLVMFAGYIHFAFMLISSREFSLARANRDQDDLQRRVLNASWWTFWLTVPMVLAILAAAYPLLALFGPEFVTGYGVLAVLGLGLIIRASVGQAGDLLILLGHQKAAFSVAAMSLALNVLIALALIPPLGMMGAAISTTCSQTARAVALRHIAKRSANLETFVLGTITTQAGR